MNGSEKQIKWAEDIKRNMLDQVAIQISNERAMDNDERNLRGLSMIADWIGGQTEAKWFIDNKGRNFTMDWPSHIEKEIYG